MRRVVPVWVVEIQFSSRWEPCAEAKLTKRAAREAVKDWLYNNPGHKFRVTKYVPARKECAK